MLSWISRTSSVWTILRTGSSILRLLQFNYYAKQSRRWLHACRRTCSTWVLTMTTYYDSFRRQIHFREEAREHDLAFEARKCYEKGKSSFLINISISILPLNNLCVDSHLHTHTAALSPWRYAFICTPSLSSIFVYPDIHISSKFNFQCLLSMSLDRGQFCVFRAFLFRLHWARLFRARQLWFSRCDWPRKMCSRLIGTVLLPRLLSITTVCTSESSNINSNWHVS